jgi:hypothetical protein
MGRIVLFLLTTGQHWAWFDVYIEQSHYYLSALRVLTIFYHVDLLGEHQQCSRDLREGLSTQGVTRSR